MQRRTLLPPVKVMGGAGCVKCSTTVATTCLPDHSGLGFMMAGACSLMLMSCGLPAAGRSVQSGRQQSTAGSECGHSSSRHVTAAGLGMQHTAEWLCAP